MKKLLILLLTCCAFIFQVGCGGENTYSPDYSGNPDFLIAVYNANATSTGDGTGKVKNDQAHQFNGPPGAKMTILVKPVGGFQGTVSLTAGQETGAITAVAPSPSSVALSGTNAVASEFSYALGGGQSKPKGVKAISHGTMIITATSGSKTHTYKVFVNYDSGEFTITVFNADAATTGSGQGKTPNDATHPFTGAPGGKMTIVVTPVGPFTGNVQLSTGNPTGAVIGTTPDPTSVMVTPGVFKAAEVSYGLNEAAPGSRRSKAPTIGTFEVTATSGSTTHTYTVHVNYDPGDFQITVYNADSATVGDGTGQTANSFSNPFTNGPNNPLTILVEPIGAFTGTVNLTVGDETGGIFAIGPTIANVNVTPSTFGASEFSYDFGGGSKLKKGTRGVVGQTITVTATSGSIVHTKIAFFSVD